MVVNGGKMQTKGEQRRRKGFIGFSRNLLVSFDYDQLRQVLMKLVVRLLTEMLEVRILPGEPFNELRTFSGNSAIRRCGVECANHDQSRSMKTNKNQLRQVPLRFVR